ncbi:MAG: LysR family transcriptional regulator [Eggerthellaceae bacterium]|nr:LysR family transcriptional regulator [Eggerthellaceae bacterium]
MDIQWLREFLLLTRTLNYRQAADQLHITPSTLSKHIALLEKEFSAQLFIRDTKSVRLTDNGRVLRDCAATIIREYDFAASQMNTGSSIQGTLRIGGGVRFSKLNDIIHPVVSCFEKKYPDVDIQLVDTQYHDYREDLLDGNFDIVFSLRLPNMNESLLEYRDLFSHPLCAWISDACRYADRQSVTMADLTELNMRILEEPQCMAYTQYLKGLFEERGLTARMGKPLNQAFTLGGDDFGPTPNFNPTDHFGFGMRSILIEDGADITFSLVRKSHISNPIAALFCTEFETLFG